MPVSVLVAGHVGIKKADNVFFLRKTCAIRRFIVQFTEMGRTGGGRMFDGVIVIYFLFLSRCQLDIHADRDFILDGRL